MTRTQTRRSKTVGTQPPYTTASPKMMMKTLAQYPPKSLNPTPAPHHTTARSQPIMYQRVTTEVTKGPQYAHRKSPQNFKTTRDASSDTTNSRRHKSSREWLTIKIQGLQQTHWTRWRWSTPTTTLETVWPYQSLQIQLDCISKVSMVYPSPRWEHGRQHAWIYKIWRLTWVC